MLDIVYLKHRDRRGRGNTLRSGCSIAAAVVVLVLRKCPSIYIAIMVVKVT